LFLEKFNISPSDYILKYGETAFRERESEVVKEIAKTTGAVISTGGGVVEREVNIQNLKINGAIIYIMRDADKLIEDGRPLSSTVGVHALFERRKQKYLDYSDIAVDNNGEIENTNKEILKAYETACNKWC
jgi:shikimate kinase